MHRHRAVLLVCALAACSGGRDSTGPAPDQVASVAVSASKSALLVGDTLALRATVEDGAGRVLTGETVVWSSSDVSKANISAGGVVTALDTGTVRLRAVVGQHADSVSLAIHTVAVVQVISSNDSIIVGQSMPLQVIVADELGQPVLGEPVSWSSSDTTRATITPAGVVTGQDSGTVTLTATVRQTSGWTALTIRLTPVSALSLDISGDTLAPAQSVQLTATPLDSLGQPSLGHTVTYSSTNGGVAQVTSDGLVSAVAQGMAGIVATSDGVADTATILVPACTPGYAVQAGRFYLPIVPGGIRSSTGVTDDGTYRTTGVIYGGGPVFGQSAQSTIIGFSPAGGTTDLAPSQVCELQGLPASHTYAKLPLAASAPALPGLSVIEETFSEGGSNDAFVLFRYSFVNRSGSAIGGFTAGFIMDWDLNFDASALSDILRYNTAGFDEAVEPDTSAHPEIMAVVPIAVSGTRTHHAWANGSDPAQRGDFYSYLTDTSPGTSLGPTDVRGLSGIGTFAVPAHGHTTVYFAIVGGDNRSDFNAAVAKAQAKAAALGY